MKSSVQRSVREDKQKYINGLCDELEQQNKCGNTRMMFKVVKKLTQKFKPKMFVIKDLDGKPLTHPNEIASRWRQYCEEMYDDEEFISKIEVQEKEPPPLRSEVARALGRMKPNKAPGPDEVPSELFKAGGDVVLDKLHKLILSVWENGEWPEEWTQTTFVPLHKKGDSGECSNYRTIALVSHASKILLKIILERIQAKTELELAPEQAGFHPRKGTRDQITNLKIIMDKAREFSQPLYLCFIDFAKAFDSVSHEKLWIAMLDMGYSPHLVQLLSNLYRNQKAAVRVAQVVSEWFQVRKGVRQGCVLSPYLFNILSEMAMREALDGFAGGLRLGGRVLTNLRYADDIVLIASSEEALQDLLDRTVTAGQRFGLKINTQKTKVMRLGGGPVNVTVEGAQLEQVTEFRYLGFSLTDSSECRNEIRNRLALGTAVISRLSTIWKSALHVSTKKRLVKALIWPVTTYGCEAWTLRKEDEKRIEAFEMKCYRRMLRIPWTAKKSNMEVLQQADANRDLLHCVRKRKLQYFGHVARQRESLEKDITLGMISGNRRRARPRTSWMSNIVEWTGMNVATACQKAQDRIGWRNMIYTTSHHRLDVMG